jgi:hypothetical protein
MSASTSTSTSSSFSTATTYRGLLGNGGVCELLADAIKQHPHDNHMQVRTVSPKSLSPTDRFEES